MHSTSKLNKDALNVQEVQFIQDSMSLVFSRPPVDELGENNWPPQKVDTVPGVGNPRIGRLLQLHQCAAFF